MTVVLWPSVDHSTCEHCGAHITIGSAPGSRLPDVENWTSLVQPAHQTRALAERSTTERFELTVATE
ncbi:hypothetical protein C482_18247 [Natrialba chahannaoensis JCM 10990]|uniref:Uncharacterized protein n=1 Tax=Natrialba chahannaoensis JCM 10990 TaxID=1227492 RepID=M0A7D9_9EURY|nr:hypothetical protein C482_18247 [Natrialba chahannaoensis JCM 10990]